jgi:indole-3-glycerol phosphate synthase/phosphoribosylanthranilate isomerase
MAEDLLGEIVRRKRSDVAQRLRGASFAAEPTRRSLRQALGRPGARFLMEVKKASPSGHRSEVSAEAAADAYAPVADAISVLTDGPFFGGSLDDLRIVRSRFDGPVLAKDFIVEPVQVEEARTHGADAVLVIMAVLSDEEAAQLLATARRLAMDVLVEVHDDAELKRAVALGADLIGINNRDLRTLTTDLAVTERLAHLVPEGAVLVSESGIRDRTGVERLAPLVDGFLVGSSLMSADDVAQAARALVFGPVKICGLGRAEDVRAAAAAGATHAGFLFAPGLARSVGAGAAELVEEARRLGLRTVGVFRDQPPSIVSQTASELRLDAVQLHGSEGDLHRLRAALPSQCEIWALCPVGDEAAPVRPGADRTLYDTANGTSCGGTGRSFDWSLLAGRPELLRAFLAGGIGPANARAAQRVGAYGLDVGSSVETAPGRKDPARLGALFDSLRPHCRRSRQCA